MILIITPNDISLQELKSGKHWPQHIRCATDVANTVLFCETLKCRDEGRDLVAPKPNAKLTDPLEPRTVSGKEHSE